jgi:hypothetical protein
VTPEPRQRWRLVVARDEAARDLVHRDVVAAWEAGLLTSGLPVSMSEGATPRPRITFAAPAPVGVLGERELIDVTLTELLPMHDVRRATEAAAPLGYRTVDLYDVWVSRPTLASLVTAGDYRATVGIEAAGPNAEASGPTVDAGAQRSEEGGPTAEASRTAPRSGIEAAVEVAVEGLLAAPRIEHIRTKGTGQVTVDIRPHIRALQVASAIPDSPEGPFVLWMRLGLGGEGGVGRPEEVVAALGERLGRRLVVRAITRERIVLADDPDA